MSAGEPTVALVFSPEPWVERLHRHLAHHGGARVRQVVVEPAIALAEPYDVLVVSDRWPALTLGFVGAVHEGGRQVLGVFDPDEPSGKDHLAALGADATIPADATVDEFVLALVDLAGEATSRPDPAHADGDRSAGRVVSGDGRGLLVAVSGTRGSGVTEVAVGVSFALAARSKVLLLDGHDDAPAIAGRLGLGLEPNLRNAVDACCHGIGIGIPWSVAVATGSTTVEVVPGHPSPVAATHVSTQDVLDVLESARRSHDAVVVDVQERSASGRAVIERADAVVGVVAASPVGVVRGIDWMLDALGRTPPLPLHVVVNRAPRSRFRREEIRVEIERAIRPTSISCCPDDQRVAVAAWAGDPLGRSAFRSACVRLAADVRTTTPRPARGPR